MKTVRQLQNELSDLKVKIEQEDDKKKEKKLRKKIPYLNTCIMYLESNPDELFIKQEIEKVETKINLRMQQFILDDIENKPKSLVSKLKRQHEKQYDIPKLREQVRTLRYLLK